MKLSIATFAFACVFALQSSSAQQCDADDPANNPFSLPTSIRLDRVRRCRNHSPWPCNGVTTRDEYRPFERMRKETQKKLYLSEVNVPSSRANTKNLALFIAGQQDSDGDSSGITGQKGNYKDHFGRKTGSYEPYQRDISSLAETILDSNLFSRDDTFVGLVFDARFNYEFGSGHKSDIEKSYVEYILSKLDTGNVETIYIAGHSRGGCLAMRVAQDLATKARSYSSNLYNARIIIQTWDPVCADSRFPLSSEFGVSHNHKVDNPEVASSSWYVHTTDIEAQFQQTRRSCLSIRAFLSGEEFIDVPVVNYGVHAFGHRGHTNAQDSINHPYGNNRAWYTQSFHTQGHNSIDSFHWATARNHLRDAMMMDCPCGKPKPPSRAPTPSPDQPCYRRRSLQNIESGLVDEFDPCGNPIPTLQFPTIPPPTPPPLPTPTNPPNPFQPVLQPIKKIPDEFKRVP